MEHQREIVVFLIDTNPIAWNNLEKNGISFSYVLSQIYSYLSQMILSDVFQLAPVIAYNQCGVHWLFPSPDRAELLIKGSLQATNTDEILSYCQSINQNLCDFAKQCANVDQTTNDVRLDVAISTALCHLNRYSSEYLKRILVITPSKDTFDDKSNDRNKESEANFESTMNSIFAAHRINVTIDSILINVPESLFLNQASILTNGFSTSICNMTRIQYLLQYLLSIPPLPIRNLIVLKKVKAIDYKTPAVNTNNLIDQGIMCPVCLSVFEKTDKPINICSVCRSNQQFLEVRGRK